MSRFLIYLGRFLLIIAGYFCAALATSAMLHLLVIPALGMPPETIASVAAGSIIFSIPFVALFVGYFAFFPSLVVIAIAELWSVRHWAFYAFAGSAVALVIAAMFRRRAEGLAIETEGGSALSPSAISVFDPAVLSVMIGAGIVGGLAYWLIAGSSSGNWRRAAPILPAP